MFSHFYQCEFTFKSALILKFCSIPSGSECVEGTVPSSCSSAAAAAATRRRTNDQQLQEINDVVEEAELAQTMIHSLAQSSGLPIVTNTRSVTGSSCITSNPLHKARSSHLNDRRVMFRFTEFQVETLAVSNLKKAFNGRLTYRISRESLTAGGNGDTKTRPLGSPRLGIASLSKASDYRYAANRQR